MKKIFKYLSYSILLILVVLTIIGLINTDVIKNGSLLFSKNWKGKFIEINGEQIRYIQKGKGYDVLLIHGTPGSLEDWQPIIKELSKNYKVTAFDRLGNGFSTANNYNYTIDENAIFVHNFINKLNLKNVVIVGHSYGGSIATKLATQENDNIKSFVIIASPLYQFKNGIDYKLLATPIIGKGLTTIVAKTIAPKIVKEGLYNAFGKNSDLITNDYLNIRTQIWSQSKVLYTTSKERGNYKTDLQKNSKLYKNITKKITFLVGKEDSKLIVADFYKTKKDIKQTKNISFNNTSHYIQFEKTKEVLQVIKEHLNTKTANE